MENSKLYYLALINLDYIVGHTFYLECGTLFSNVGF
jgi:hypothetical protein